MREERLVPFLPLWDDKQKILFYFATALTVVAGLRASVVAEETLVTGIAVAVTDFAGYFARALALGTDAALDHLKVGPLTVLLKIDVVALGITAVGGG